MSTDYAVFVDANRHSCIRVAIGHKHTKFIPLAAGELRVHQLSNAEFDKDYTELPDYAPQRAATLYLFDPDGVKREISTEARAHLERLAGPPRKREEPIEDDPAPQPKEETAMTEAATQTTAPAKRKPAPPAAKKSDAPAKKTATAKKAEAPAKKTAKKAEAAEAGARGRAPNIAGTAKIKLLTKENPKRAAAAERFALYKNGMTVDEYIAAGGKRADVNWDVAQGFIEVK